jgi:hypothetical protein
LALRKILRYQDGEVRDGDQRPHRRTGRARHSKPPVSVEHQRKFDLRRWRLGIRAVEEEPRRMLPSSMNPR